MTSPQKWKILNHRFLIFWHGDKMNFEKLRCSLVVNTRLWTIKKRHRKLALIEVIGMKCFLLNARWVDLDIFSRLRRWNKHRSMNEENTFWRELLYVSSRKEIARLMRTNPRSKTKSQIAEKVEEATIQLNM